MADVSDALRVVVGLAEKATDGPWVWSENGNIYGGPEGRFDDVDEVCAVYTDDDETGAPNAPAIIAAVNFIREHGAALAQALENDARYRWLFDGAGDDVCIRAQGASPGHPHLYAYWKCVDKSKIDAFIDSAIAAQQKEMGHA